VAHHPERQHMGELRAGRDPPQHPRWVRHKFLTRSGQQRVGCHLFRCPLVGNAAESLSHRHRVGCSRRTRGLERGAGR
jgi:hypothetical protein